MRSNPEWRQRGLTSFLFLCMYLFSCPHLLKFIQLEIYIAFDRPFIYVNILISFRMNTNDCTTVRKLVLVNWNHDIFPRLWRSWSLRFNPSRPFSFER